MQGIRAPGGRGAATMRNTATTLPMVMDQQIAKGQLEVNIGALSHDDLMDLMLKLKDSAERIKSLRLVCMPKGIVWLQYKYDAHQDSRARQKFIFHTQTHHDVVNQSTKHLQSKRLRLRVKEALVKVLLHSSIEDLQIGARLAPSGYKAIAEGLARNHTLRRLSFAGSHMGDYALQLMQEGLVTNSSLEELDLTACGLTNDGADIVASVLKRHADKRVEQQFDRRLREYPDISRDATAARVQHQRALKAANSELDAACGGLMHLELAENRINDQGVFRLCTALGYDRRLVLLSLRANALTVAAEKEVVELMKDHRALLRVDLRQNPDPKLGILKLRKPRVPPAFNPALGFAKPQLVRPGSPTRTEHSAALWELLDTASLAGMSLAGSYIGPVPNSPMTVNGGAGTGRELRRSPSVVSWGDEQLLTSNGLPSMQHQALQTVHHSGSPPQSPLGRSLLSRSSLPGPKVLTQSWSSDAAALNASSSGSHPVGADHQPHFPPIGPVGSGPGHGMGPQQGLVHASTDRYDDAEHSIYTLSGRPAPPNILGDLPSSPLATRIFDDVDRPPARRRRSVSRPARARPVRPWHTAPHPKRSPSRGAQRYGALYGVGARGRSASPRKAGPSKKKKKKKNAKAQAAARRVAAEAARRATEARSVTESRALAEAAAAATAQLVQRDMEAVDELALMFRDLEVAVSSLELMYELQRDEPRQFKQYKQQLVQQQQQQHLQHLRQLQQQLMHPVHGGTPALQQGTLAALGAAAAAAGVGPGVGPGASPAESLLAVQHAALVAGGEGQQEVPASPAVLAQQFRRWRDLCDSALLEA